MKTRSFPNMIFGVIIVISLSIASIGYATDTVRVWYGNFDGSPIWAFPGYPTRVDVWIQTGATNSINQMHLCLGTLDQYIDSLITPDSGDDCPYTTWDSATVNSANYHTPPNIPGWSSQSFIGKADTGGVANNYIQSRFPKRFLTFYLLPQNDQNLLGDTISCLGMGYNPTFGSSWVNGLNGPLPIREYYSPLNFVPPPDSCDYTIVNDPNRLVGVVTYIVYKLKGTQGPIPPEFLCNNPALPGDHGLYALYDYNGDCRLSGADAIYLVGYLKGRVCKLYDCPLTPYRLHYVR